ncbi:hypothetical protein [Aeoliella sp. SH292]|uniref:hypothetical protein n=1 Tax=Aeoliella sp. SH292 TaxID=3454464 RepID=UPI003F95DCAF
MLEIRFHRLVLGSAVCCLLLAARVSVAQDDFNREPILYHTSPVADAVALLQKRMDRGDVKLAWDKRHGWLPSLLGELKIPQSSQTLVYSKTSLQLTKISPHRPRALYYNDDVYVGEVQFGNVLEIAAVDPELGAVFYTIDQTETDKPQLVRDNGLCLGCHDTGNARAVPGLLVRSVFAQEDGEPRYDLGTAMTTLATPFQDRFGGWYVTGTHGEMRHRGNLTVDEEGEAPTEFDEGANVTELTERVNTKNYLTPHSDLVALLVLQHQAQMHNALTHASYEAKRASHYDETWNKILEQPADFENDISKRRIARAGDELVEQLLFAGEWQLTSPVTGTSSFAEEFEKLGPRDQQGRSLREFDLQRRMFKYPCSYLIYSDSFASLPEKMRSHVDARLAEVLLGRDNSEKFAHLSSEDRQAIREILAETLDGFDEVLSKGTQQN